MLMPHGSPQPAAGESKQKVMGSPSPEAWERVKKQAQTQLDQCGTKTTAADAKLDAVIASFSGKGNDAMGQPVMPAQAALVALQKAKVTVSIDNVGSEMMPTLLVKDSLMDEGRTLAGAPPAKMMAFAKKSQAAQPALNALRADVQAVNQALSASFDASTTCTQGATAYSTMLGAIENGGDSPPDDVFDVYAKLLQANARSQAVAAAGIALLGATQATLAGNAKGDAAKALGQILDGVVALKSNAETVSTDQARKVYKAAGQSLIDACQAQLDKYYSEHPDAKKPDGPSPCSKEGLAKDKEKWNRGPGHGPSSDDASASSGGGGGGGDDDVTHLLPKDSLPGQAAAAFGALKKGDYVGAFKGALKMVGKNVPFGGVISSVLSIFG
jgi:hypothetical protein